MRDVSAKNFTLRTAKARAVLTVSPATLALIRAGKVPKGDPLPVAKVAAIQAEVGVRAGTAQQAERRARGAG